MKKIFPLLIFFLFINCSTEEPAPQPQPTPDPGSQPNPDPDPETDPDPEATVAIVENVNPQRLKIGDTISINGENLKEITRLKFEHEQGMYSSYDKEMLASSFVTHEDDHIEVVIPPAVVENINLVIGSGSYPVELYGFIPLPRRFDNSRQIQTLDENTAFILTDKRLYKSTDGYYTWSPVIEYIDGYPHTFFFLNENQGWMAYYDPLSGPGLYYTMNGGKDFDLLFQVEEETQSNIRKIHFVHENLGYLIDGSGKVIVIENNEPIDIYEYYPQLNNPEIAPIDIWDLTAVNEDLLFLAPNDREFLVKIENGNVSYSHFDIWPMAPQFFGDTGYLQVNSDIFKSTDRGDTWNKIKTYENYYPRIHFFDEEKGLAFVNYNPEQIFETRDGGETWKDYPLPATVQTRAQATETTDFFTGSLGLMGSGLVKYIKE